MSTIQQKSSATSAPRSGNPTQTKSEQQSLARRFLGAPGNALKPLSKAEQIVVGELRRTARQARRRVGL